MFPLFFFEIPESEKQVMTLLSLMVPLFLTGESSVYVTRRGLEVKKTIIILLIILVTPLSALSETVTKSLRLGYIEFPPFTSTNDKGEPEGILIDLAAKVFPTAGYEWSALPYPVKRLSEYMGSGDIDVWMGLKTLPAFVGKTYAGDVPIAYLLLNAYTTGDNPPVTQKEHLSGKSVIIMRGYSYGGWINYIMDKKNNVSYLRANKHASALKMLKAKRADYLLDYKEPIEMALETVSVSELKINKISSLPCYFVVTKQLPDGAEIVTRLETVFLKMKENGQL